MATTADNARFPVLVLQGFVAGFFATLIFHQLSLALLAGAGLAPFKPFQMAATPPFGIPAMFSLAFWGGIWGIAYAAVHRRFPSGGGYWIVAFVLGGLLPSLVALLIVLPIKGMPPGGGGSPALLLTAFLINGAWGVGTGLILRLQAGMRRG